MFPRGGLFDRSESSWGRAAGTASSVRHVAHPSNGRIRMPTDGIAVVAWPAAA